MKILISPSKTQDFTHQYPITGDLPLYADLASTLNRRLMRMSGRQLGTSLHISGDLLKNTKLNILNYEVATGKPAIATYTGLVYKNLNLSVYGPTEIDYMDQHLRILSAYYGVLKPFDLIKPYRLDMKATIGKKSLYEFWAQTLTTYFSSDEQIIDLASTEFSKMVQLPKVAIGFRDFKNGQYINLATYAKMARGQLLHRMIMGKITTLDQLKSLTFSGYGYNPSLSSSSELIFTRASEA